MQNIGKEMARKLRNIGICNAEELREIGSKEAFIRLKNAYPEVCLVHLYALQAATDNLAFNQLSQTQKADLKKFNATLN